jgi:SAM-dependent methyltransferase
LGIGRLWSWRVPQASGIIDQSDEALLPEIVKGQLVEAERVARYWWLTQAVGGLRVLDAGCGLAHGARLLADAGAREVVGIDHNAALLEAAAPDHPAVRIEHADAYRLNHEDGSFQVVAAFGLLDQVAQAKSALSELLRVLAPDGMIAVSVASEAPPTSLADAAEGNKPVPLLWGAQPLARTIQASVGQRCRHNTVLLQRNWLASAILDEGASASSDGEALAGVELRKVVAPAAKSEIATLIVGSHEPLSSMHATAVMTHDFAQRRWLERCAFLERELQDRAQLRRSLQDAHHERRLLAERVHELERHLREQIPSRETDHPGC